MSAVECRKFRPGDEAEILSVLQEAFPNWRLSNVDYWRWKYLEGPVGEYVYVAEMDGEIVSAICDLGLRIKVGERLVNAVYSDDSATKAKYRGKGIYSRLDKFCRADRVSRGFTFVYYATENRIVYRMGAELNDKPFPWKLTRMMRVRNVEEYLRESGRYSIVNRVGLTALKAMNKIANVAKSGVKASREFSIKQVDSFGGAIEKFWDTVKRDYNFILEKDRSYLNWRYCSYDSEHHIVKVALDDDEVLGYCVCRNWEQGGHNESTILDILALTDRLDVANSLLDDAVSTLENNGSNSIYAQIIAGHPYHKLLSEKGFIDVTRASRNLLYYNDGNPNFDFETFSNYRPETIYFNYY